MRGMRFILAFCVTIVAMLGVLAGVFSALDSAGKLKAPSISDRRDFNEKLRFMRHQGVDRIDVLLIGSSVALYGVDGRTLESMFGDDVRVFNMGAGGLGTLQIAEVARFMREQFPSIHTVIMVAMRGDFGWCPSSEAAFFDSARAADYLFGRSTEIAMQLKFLDPKGVLKALPGIAAQRLDPDIHDTVYFDAWGSSLRDPPPEIVPEFRWIGRFGDLDDRCYDALADLARWLRGNDIRFVYVAAPLRPGHLELFDPAGERLEAHTTRAARIVEKAGGIFVDAHAELGLSDAEFYDAYHIKRSISPRLSHVIGSALTEEPAGEHDISAGPPATLID